MKCTHDTIRQLDDVGGFVCPVAVEPYTSKNRAAHGNIQVTEECATCGAQRQTLINGLHEEHSPWGPSRAERDRAERERLRREEHAEVQARLRAAEVQARAEELRRTLGPVVLTGPRGERVVVSVDDEGLLWARGAPAEVIEGAWGAICGALATDRPRWLEQAQEIRRAVTDVPREHDL